MHFSNAMPVGSAITSLYKKQCREGGNDSDRQLMCLAAVKPICSQICKAKVTVFILWTWEDSRSWGLQKPSPKAAVSQARLLTPTYLLWFEIWSAPYKFTCQTCWLPAGGSISEGSRNLRGRVWLEETYHWRHAFEHWVPSPLLTFLLSTMKGKASSSTCCCHDVLQWLTVWCSPRPCPAVYEIPCRRTKSFTLSRLFVFPLNFSLTPG